MVTDAPAIVFAGPSVTPAIRAEFHDVEWRPPVAAGDLVGLPDRVRLVAIIDGLFEQCRSVWHKEILLALSEGRHVVGASSMGALRAAELWRHGMTGCGIIYQAYRSGRIDGDDEVAVTHAPDTLGWRPLSLPLVNLRATVARAVAQGVVPGSLAPALVTSARTVFYGDRTWPVVLAAWQADRLMTVSQTKAFGTWLADGEVDLKRRDARVCLQRLRLVLARPIPVLPSPPGTIFLESFLAEVHSHRAISAQA